MNVIVQLLHNSSICPDFINLIIDRFIICTNVFRHCIAKPEYCLNTQIVVTKYTNKTYKNVTKNFVMDKEPLRRQSVLRVFTIPHRRLLRVCVYPESRWRLNGLPRNHFGGYTWRCTVESNVHIGNIQFQIYIFIYCIRCSLNTPRGILYEVFAIVAIWIVFSHITFT